MHVAVDAELHKQVKYWATLEGRKIQFMIDELLRAFIAKKQKQARSNP